MIRICSIALVVGMALAFPLWGHSESSDGIGKNMEALIQQLINNQQRMETEIQRLQKQIQQKDREITELREWIQQLKNEWLSQVRGELDERIRIIQTPAGERTPDAVDAYSARLQYDRARELMHEAIFNVRKGEQGPWFRRVVEEFRKVADNYPQSSEAAESQIRISRIYRRYLGDIIQARQEYQAFLDRYPDNKYATEARQALRELENVK